MPKEKQTSGWEQRYNTLTKHSQFVDHSRIMEFIASERIAVAKAMAEAVLPEEEDVDIRHINFEMIVGMNAMVKEVSRRAEEFIAKL